MSSSHAIRVLLIDDHKTMLWGLGKLIDSEDASMEVAGCAGDCATALAAAQTLAPDVIVLDLDLGGVCSLDILPALLAGGARVLVLSGTRERSQLDSAVLHGAHGVVGKDAPAEIVIKAIRKIHDGELWLDQCLLGRVFEEMRHPKCARVDPEAAKLATLTAKELKICQLITMGGGNNKTLAQQLFISEHTLRNHLTTIYHKLGVGNRLDLYVYVMRHDLDRIAA